MQSILTAETQSLAFPAGHTHAATQVASVRRPPPKAPSRRLSGRPSCRIYLARRAWILQFDSICGGWIEPWRCDGPAEPKTLAFPTLAAAVDHAERHGYDYRIEAPTRPARPRRQGIQAHLPRSWLALLPSNARNGAIYHG
jgi:hypothetical protein